MMIAARTDRGKVRAMNQDSYYAEGELLLVADGMGGHLGGEIASAMAIETISRGVLALDTTHVSTEIDRVFQEANRRIYERSIEDENLRGMGTTATMCLVRGNIAYIAHIGDSRGYLWRNGRLQRLTRDHSLVEEMVRGGYITREEARVHPHRNIITRALGSEGEVRVDQRRIAVQGGDEILLCSDGITMYLDDPDIERLLAGKADVHHRAAALLGEAMRHGGEDNITVALARVEGGALL